MFKKLVSLLVALLVFSATAADDYMFPSPNPPANLKPSEVDQYVIFIWDDNAYSGLKGSPYESKPNSEWKDISRVEGYQFKSWHSDKNDLNLKEGDIGVSWAIRNLLPSSNPDGSKPSMTFNVITGQMAPVTWKTGWVENPVDGDVWGWKEEAFQTVSWADPTKTVLAPVCWGREYEVFTNGGSEAEEEPHAKRVYTEAIEKGHEIGNHTIDHMETNSGLPNNDKAFKKWDSEGFDPGAGKEVDFNGKPQKEQYPAWDVIGWDWDAGRKISKKAWKGAIELGEAELTEHLDLSVEKGNLHGFRAPRLETNSAMLHALKELNYVYDCGMEEGFEANMDGTNALWPYTMDNGSPNHWLQKDFGVKSAFESYPTGFWQIPVNVLIVPEDIRPQVWDRAKEINENAPEAEPIEDKASWVKHGRMTGFDFNMFILWGMTKDDFVKTLKYNLDLRLANNKAPFQVGLHADYFTPMYDNATLLNDVNKDSYGLVVTKGWNTYKIRQEALKEFVDYAKSKNVNFVSGIELIKKMRDLQKKDKPGKEKKVNDLISKWKLKWEFFASESSTTNEKEYKGDIKDAKVKVKGNETYTGYSFYAGTNFFSTLDHISLDYETNEPLKIVIQVKDDKPWEVILGNVNTKVNSGKIPLSAFRYNPYGVGKEKKINTDKIQSINVQVAVPNLSKDTEVKFNISNVKLYGDKVGEVVGVNSIASVAKTAIALHGMTKNTLNLNIGKAGVYTVNVVSANGKVIRSFKNMNLSTGMKTLPLNNLSNGMYFVRLKNANQTVKTIKTTLM